MTTRAARHNALGVCPFDGAGDFVGVLGGLRGGEDCGDCADLLGQSFWPGDDCCGRGGGGVAQVEGGVDLGGSGTRRLELGAEPADLALGLFGGAGLVERDQAREDFFVA